MRSRYSAYATKNIDYILNTAESDEVDGTVPDQGLSHVGQILLQVGVT